MLECDSCGGPAVFSKRRRDVFTTGSSVLRFCRDCFCLSLRDRVFDNLRSHRMLRDGDRVLLCVSGEKDSTVLFHLLCDYLDAGGPDIDLTVLSVDEGIGDYRTQCVEVVRRQAQARNIRFVTRSFTSSFNKSLDDIFGIRPDDAPRMCNFCCSLRARAVKAVADDLNATTLATGMTLNDAVEHALMCVMKGAFDRQALPVHTQPGGKVRIIAPLYNVTGLECGLYTRLKGIEHMNEDCKYCNEHLRDNIAESLNLLEDRNPGMLEIFYSGYLALAEADGRGGNHT